MINLIPAKAKRRLSIEYWSRVVTVWMIVWSVAFVFGVLVLLPTYVLIGSQVAAYQISVSTAYEDVVNYENVSDTMMLSNVQAKSVVRESKLYPLSGYIDLLVGLQGYGVKVNEIQLAREELETTPILLRGVATDRQALASFRDRVLALEIFSTVDLPISNLARDKNIAFAVTIMLNKVEEI